MIKRIFLITLSCFVTLIIFFGITYLAADKSANNATKNFLGANQNYFTESFDSWTLCVSGMAFSGYDESKSVIWNSVIAPQLIGFGNQTPCEILTQYSNSENYLQNYTYYSRYWHGSGAVFVIISSLINFEGFKTFYFLLIIFSLIFYGSMWNKTEYKAAPIFFLIPILLSSNHLLFQNNFAHILPLISSLIAGGIIGRLQEKKHFIVIFVAGMWANFLDLLTSPFLFFSITLFAYMVPRLTNGPKVTIKHFLIALTTWFGGYFVAWISKWFLAEILGQRGEIRKAIDQSLLRTTGPAFNDADPSLVYPTVKNLNDFLNQPFSSWSINSSFFAITIVLIIFIIFRQKKFLESIIMYVSLTILFLGLWYAVLRNHSLIHSWFTFRSISVIPALIISLSYFYTNFSIRNRSKRILN